jgi:hypothetical protein
LALVEAIDPAELTAGYYDRLGGLGANLGGGVENRFGQTDGSDDR